MERPNLSDPLSWAAISVTYAKWIREVGSQYGIDTAKFLLGDVLASIIGDDSNCFPYNFEYNPDDAAMCRQFLLIRMNWEITTPEIPDVIRTRLQTFLTENMGQEWDSESIYLKTKKEWAEKVKKFTQEQIKINPPWEEAINYHLHCDRIVEVSKAWEKFLHGK